MTGYPGQFDTYLANYFAKKRKNLWCLTFYDTLIRDRS